MSETENMQTPKKLMNNEEVRIVMVGKTGVGKSATGNTILGKTVFESDLSSSSVTTDCEKVRGTVQGRRVAIIDTPGIFDTKLLQEDIIEKIKVCILLSAPGPHVFLVTIQLGRFTKEEQETLEIIKGIFGEASSKYIMVLFTHGDKLKKKNICDYIKGSPDLQEFIQSSSGHYLVFNNEDEDRTQVAALLKKIDQLVIENGGQHYTNEIVQMAENTIQKIVSKLQEENSTLSVTEARNIAERKNDFFDTDWRKLVIGGGVAISAITAVAKFKCTIQ